MGTIRGIYTFFSKKRNECENETLRACMDIVLVITGDFFHQKYSWLCCNKQHLNERSRDLSITSFSITHSRRVLRQDIHILRIDVQNRVLHSHSEVSQLLRDLLVPVELPSHPHAAPYIQPRLDAERHARRERRVEGHRRRVVVVQSDEVPDLRITPSSHLSRSEGST